MLFTLTACGGPSLRPEVGARLKAGKVAAAVYMEDKSIDYNELVYKVMWNQEHHQRVTFAGLWDVDTDLTEKFAKALQGIGLSTVPANKVLSGIDFKVLIDALAATRAGPLELSSDTREQLRKAGVDYFIALRAAHFTVQTGSFWFGNLGLSMPSLLVVYDVKGAQEEHRDLFSIGRNMSYENSPRDIEQNGLAQLREAMYSSMETTVTDRMPDVLSLPY
jgi:hypothetical protein